MGYCSPDCCLIRPYGLVIVCFLFTSCCRLSNAFLREEHAMLEAFIRRQGPQETAPQGPQETAPQGPPETAARPPGDPAMAEGSPQPARVSQIPYEG